MTVFFFQLHAAVCDCKLSLMFSPFDLFSVMLSPFAFVFLPLACGDKTLAPGTNDIKSTIDKHIYFPSTHLTMHGRSHTV